MRTGIYPGSFDPMTNGHLDIIKRTAKLCSKLIIAVGINSSKKSLFSFDERKEMILKSIKGIDGNFEVVALGSLIVDYCVENNVSFIVRGLRSTTDFEYELAIATVNRTLAPTVETVFLMASGEYASISSNIVKEVGSFGGDISTFVPSFVNDRVEEKFSNS